MVLRAGDGRGCHIESGFRFVSRCGRVFDPADVDEQLGQHVDGEPQWAPVVEDS